MSPARANRSASESDDVPDEVPRDVESSSRRVTRSMAAKLEGPLDERPAESTPAKQIKRRQQLSPYFTPTPARKRATLPADLEPFILAEQLRPATPLHPIERKPTDFGLLQELMAASEDFPIWKLIIAVCLLNQTAGRAVRPVLWQLLERYPTPADLAAADEMELTALLYPIGLYRIRAKRLKAFSAQYVAQPPGDEVFANKNDKHYIPTPISHYVGVGTYALDSYQIFCAGGGASVLEPRSALPDAPWRAVLPADKELRKYLAWRHAIDGTLWIPEQGVVGPLPHGHEMPKPGYLTSQEAFSASTTVSSPLPKPEHLL